MRGLRGGGFVRLKIVWNVIKAVFLGYAAIFAVALTVALWIAAAAILKPILKVKRLRDNNPKETIYMRNERELLASQHLPDTLSQTFVPLDSISPNLVKAVLAAEDDGFYMHPGFDVTAIAEAARHNSTRNGRRHGASTITQQMAKNLFAGGEKTFNRKYRELAYAVLMEYFLGKDRILELYMNYAQWGRNIFGCEAASRAYFDRSCSNLSFEEAARMAAVLAKPERLNPHFTKSVLLQKRMTVIANNLYRRRSIDTTTWAELGGSDSLLATRAASEGYLRGDSLGRAGQHDWAKRGAERGPERTSY
jgi:monofunctional biosynthetic peptidoglycan transglycosylase